MKVTDPNTGQEHPVEVTGHEPIVRGGGQPMVGGIPAQPAPSGASVGTVMQPANVASVQPGDDIRNPLGEPTIRVRIRPGVEFYPQFAGGEKVRENEEYDVPISMARAASVYLDEIADDGTLRAVPHEQQRIGGMPPRANTAGRPAHERVGELEAELKRLDERRADVQKQLDFENAKIAAAHPAVQPATTADVQPTTANTNAQRPGDGGATFATAPGPGR
jgi:hypothetical protein